VWAAVQVDIGNPKPKSLDGLWRLFLGRGHVQQCPTLRHLELLAAAGRKAVNTIRYAAFPSMFA
jgi:hypothetical protein